VLHKLKPYSNYATCLCDIMDAESSSYEEDVEPSNYEEVAEKRVWKGVMGKEYHSMVKNDVWDVVPRLKEKSVVISKWIYKMKHAGYGNIEKYKARFMAQGFS
jgi:hypothetical protein